MKRVGLTLLVALTIVTVAALVGCGGSAQSSIVPTTVQNVSASELQALMGPSDQMVILDVRSAEEYDGGHIPGAVNIPLDELPDRLDELSPGVPTACVCSGGFRSIQAAQMLVDAGFSTVLNLEDGLRNWTGDWEPDCPTCG